jgi:hypothetical protein
MHTSAGYTCHATSCCCRTGRAALCSRQAGATWMQQRQQQQCQRRGRQQQQQQGAARPAQQPCCPYPSRPLAGGPCCTPSSGSSSSSSSSSSSRSAGAPWSCSQSQVGLSLLAALQANCARHAAAQHPVAWRLCKAAGWCGCSRGACRCRDKHRQQRGPSRRSSSSSRAWRQRRRRRHAPGVTRLGASAGAWAAPGGSGRGAVCAWAGPMLRRCGRA